MRILHYIPKKQHSGLLADYLSLLLESMDKFADATLTTSPAQFRQAVQETRPDIIHIHGCWSMSAARMLTWAEQRGLPVVLSLHGSLMPWVWKASRMANDVKRMASVEKAVRQADAVQVDSEMEQRRMEQLAWNPRLALVMNSLYTNRTNPGRMAAQMVTLYQKVIDSNTFRLMTADEKTAENILLRQGITPEGHQSLLTAPPEMFGLFSEDDWRKVLIHAGDEHIADYVKEGARRLGFSLDGIVTDQVDRFPQKLQKPDGLLPTDHLSARHAIKTKSTIDHLRQDEKPSETEMAICHLLINVQHHLRRQSLSRRHLAQLFALLRFNDYDEDKLSRMLQKLKLTKFTARLLQILQESLGLEEGYMPIEPRNDNTANLIKKQLLSINIQ